ncbi:MAG: LysE family translocator [Burkholderiaceae bacterium]
MSLELWLAFMATSTVLAISPGPDNLFVLMQSAVYGRSAGLWVTLGLCTGLVFHTLAVVLGVAVIFQTSALAFTALKLAGAAYLVWLAWQAWNAPVTAGEKPGTAPDEPRIAPSRLWQRGVLMNLSNPKVVIFFLALFPQFINAKAAVTPQMLVMGASFIGVTLLVFGAIAWAAGSLRQHIARPAVQRGLNRGAAAVFTALALRLALAER